MEKLLFCLTVLIMGLATVFVGLVILIAMIKLISWIIQRAQTPKDAPKAGPVVTPAAPAPVVEPVKETVTATDDPQLIAVIAAAIAAFQPAGKRLVVRSVRRLGSRSAWADAGRREQLY